MSVKDDLIAAKALIQKPEKWSKKDGYNWHQDGCFCAAFAIVEVCGNRGIDGDIAVQALAAQPPIEAAGMPFSAVFEFNDRPTTTHTDIMALFDRAIEAAQ